MAEYTLMNKNHPVVSFRYDRDIHAVVKIVDVHDLRDMHPWLSLIQKVS